MKNKVKVIFFANINLIVLGFALSFLFLAEFLMLLWIKHSCIM
jgi:hypothetical protein